jgi:shikimate dehydrogenase
MPQLAPQISGRTRLYGILADPIGHVKTPEAMNALFAARGVDGVLVPFHVRAEGLGVLLDGLRRTENFGGFIATVPHKTAMLGLCDAVEGDAARIGAVNAVRREADGRMIGAMLDGDGFVAGLRAAGVEPRGMRALLAGAGGAASAMAFALAAAGVASLTIANRTEAKARELATRVAAAYLGVAVAAGPADPRGMDLIANGTALGMRPDDPPPVDLSGLSGGQIVAEAIMEPAETPLLSAARAAGCRVQPGRPMLDHQIELMARHMGAIA